MLGGVWVAPTNAWKFDWSQWLGLQWAPPSHSLSEVREVSFELEEFNLLPWTPAPL